MEVKLFYDNNLAHASYAIVSNGFVALIDPARDPKPYLDFARQKNAEISAVIETHPHADFVSSHLEIAKITGAVIYVSKLVQPYYKHTTFDDGDRIPLGAVTLHALNTPGHSPDSICILLKDEKGKDHAVFTGDTLFIGDVGRPDLREEVGSLTAKREELARALYHSLHTKLMVLSDDVIVYPAHGAGSLCGKNLSSDTSSTIGREKKTNYALQVLDENKFVEVLLEDQPFIPKYFGYDVELNRSGAPNISETLAKVKTLKSVAEIPQNALIVDTRKQALFNAGHLPNTINILVGNKFETWLGSIIGSDEQYYLIAENETILSELIYRTAKIGYELNMAGALAVENVGNLTSDSCNLEDFNLNPENYTIVDIRNASEIKTGKIFENSIHIPLPELRERVGEIPIDKPIMIHCAGGYRSAAGMSIVKNAVGTVPVIDLGECVLDYVKPQVGV